MNDPLSNVLSAPKVTHLVVHCSDTPDHFDLGAADIHALHLGFGWDGIGYHRVIRRDGRLEMGRPEYWVGAHVYGHNAHSLGICLIGRHFPGEAQARSLLASLREWRERYPLACICGHRDFPATDKTCPNFDVRAFCLAAGIDPLPMQGVAASLSATK